MNPRHFLRATCFCVCVLVACGASPGGHTVTSAPQLAGTCQPGAAAQEASAMMAQLPDKGPARELQNAVWLNSPQPLRLANLRGQVVLLDMWTFECINCQHVLPSLRTW